MIPETPQTELVKSWKAARLNPDAINDKFYQEKYLVQIIPLQTPQIWLVAIGITARGERPHLNIPLSTGLNIGYVETETTSLGLTIGPVSDAVAEFNLSQLQCEKNDAWDSVEKLGIGLNRSQLPRLVTSWSRYAEDGGIFSLILMDVPSTLIWQRDSSIYGVGADKIMNYMNTINQRQPDFCVKPLPLSSWSNVST